MKIVKDAVPVDTAKMYRYEIYNADGTSKGEYIYLKYAPGELAQVPTPINAALFEDMYGYSNETLTVNENGAIVRTCGSVTEITTVLENGSVQTVKTDGVKTITLTMTVNADGSITKVVS